MTKRQMISTLKGLEFGTVVGSKGVEALEMAIKALSQEPCTDAVSRDAVIEMAYDMSEIDGEHFTEPHMVVDVEDIQKLPPVTPKPIECNDAISRDAVLSKIQRYNETEGGFSLINSIKELPSVTQKSDNKYRKKAKRWKNKWLKSQRSQKSGKWIPVSERLPEDGTYLVTVERMDGEPRIDMKSFAKDLHKVDEFDFPKHKCGWYDYDSEYGYWEDTRVIAWMPLPKPYEPQESEDKE